MGIKSFDRASLNLIRKDADAALAAVAAKYGISMKLGSLRFTESSFTAKLEAAIGGQTPEEVRFSEYAPLIGLDVKMLGKSVHFSGEVFVVRGLKNGAKSVLIEKNGRVFRAPVDRFIAGARLV